MQETNAGRTESASEQRENHISKNLVDLRSEPTKVRR